MNFSQVGVSKGKTISKTKGTISLCSHKKKQFEKMWVEERMKKTKEIWGTSIVKVMWMTIAIKLESK